MKESITRIIGIALAFALLFQFTAMGQASRVSGVVTDADTGEPLPGVFVYTTGSANGLSTDLSGRYSINVRPGESLVFSLLGYRKETVPVNGNSTVNVAIHPETSELEDLVVIGYGAVRKSDLTGSVSSVKSEELTSYAVSNPIQALQGRVAGVAITTNSGSPDGRLNVRVRGTNSIKGSNDPLYIIDGIPQSTNSINSYDIASVEILKDASATAIYGSRGANGVVLITTRQGKAGDTVVEYNGEVGRQSPIKKMELMNASEWAKMVNIAMANTNGGTAFTDAQIEAFGEGFDWQDECFQNALIQNHNVNVSGGSDNTRFNISGSALLHDGLIKSTYFNKLNLRSNITHKINDLFSINLTTAYSNTRNSSDDSGRMIRGQALVSSIYCTNPAQGPYDDEGNYRMIGEGFPFMVANANNPVNRINEISNISRSDISDINGALIFTPTKALTFKSTLGYEATNTRTDKYVTSLRLNSVNSANIDSYKSSTIVNENTVTYDKRFGADHHLTAMGGYTYQEYNYRNVKVSGKNFISDATETNDIGSAQTLNNPSSSFQKWVLMSWLGRVNYSYKERYLLTASIRADGSSRYSEGNKWGFFPSAAVAWRVSEEPFMKDIEPISNLKLRASYGETGSTAISPYATMNLLSSGKVPIGDKGDMSTSESVSSSYPGDLKWETTAQWNVGFDLGLFGDRLRITADYYDKMTRDLLNSVKLPPSSGYGSTLQNIGKMRNNGVEFTIEGNIIENRDWSWFASFNFTHNKNTVEKLYNGDDIFGDKFGLTLLDDSVNLIRENESMGVFFVYEEEGYDENGAIKWVNRDDNVAYNNADKAILGNPHPDFIFGFTNELSWKNLTLSMLFQGSVGNDIFNLTSLINYDYNQGLNMSRDVLYNHWTPENPNAKYPKPKGNTNLKVSDRFIEDGSYVRLKNIQLSYDLPVRALGIQRMVKGAKIYVSGQNLLTFTRYSGIDPDVNSEGGDITTGIDRLGYPNYKAITAGINLKF